MAIVAKNKGGSSVAPIEAGTYAARCYSMIHIGTIEETILGDKKTLNKVRIGWELPTEMHVFNDEKGPEPRAISEEYTLSMHEKSTLRPFLEGWRGRGFTEEEAEAFDITALLGIECMITIIHKKAKNGNTYAKVTAASKMPKGMECPPQINATFLLDYDNFSMEKVNSLPDFIQEKIFNSAEFNALQGEAEQEKQVMDPAPTEDDDDLPF